MAEPIPIRRDSRDLPTDDRLIRFAKNLAWELKTETPLFDIQTMDAYWNSLPREQKLRYIAGVESVVQTMLQALDSEKAIVNVTIAWLQGVMR